MRFGSEGVGKDGCEIGRGGTERVEKRCFACKIG